MSFSQFGGFSEITMNFCAYFGKAKGNKKQFKSCGDLTIYPIREIKGNRIIYGDQFDAVESESENCYFVKNAEFHPDLLDPDSDSYREDELSDDALTEDDLIDETVYAEIDRRPFLKFSKSFEYIQSITQNKSGLKEKNDKLRDLKKFHNVIFSSHPSLNSYHRNSTDSGYRSIGIHETVFSKYLDTNHLRIFQAVFQEPRYVNWSYEPRKSGESFQAVFLHHLYSLVVTKLS